MASIEELHCNFRLWIYSEKTSGVFGDGKVRLLQAVESCGSLQVAANELGISYRKAWGDLKKAELCLGVILIERTRGGKDGGGMVLTEKGREILLAFLEFRNALKEKSEFEFKKFKERIERY